MEASALSRDDAPPRSISQSDKSLRSISMPFVTLLSNSLKRCLISSSMLIAVLLVVEEEEEEEEKDEEEEEEEEDDDEEEEEEEEVVERELDSASFPSLPVLGGLRANSSPTLERYSFASRFCSPVCREVSFNVSLGAGTSVIAIGSCFVPAPI
jgi:hypothetical protein